MQYSAQCLAYMGDAVFELYVRKMLLSGGSRSTNKLHGQARQYVSAPAQAAMYHHIEDSLTTEELAIMRRGRNQKKTGTTDYRHATGLEALFGHLFLTEQHSRIAEIFEICTEIGEECEQQKT